MNDSFTASPHLLEEFTKDTLKIRIYDSEQELGRASGECVAAAILELQDKDEVNIFVSIARSQELMFRTLEKHDLPWEKINLFQVIEYAGLPPGDKNRLSSRLRGFFSREIKFKNTFSMDPMAQNSDIECKRYEALLRDHGIDIALLGIGDNGHLAYNEPHAADFNDPVWVKKIAIDDVSKNQLLSQKSFSSAAEVPDYAYTVTIPALMSSPKIICTVPSKTKAEACKNAVFFEISETCPASILRRHADAALFLDTESAGLFFNEIL